MASSDDKHDVPITSDPPDQHRGDDRWTFPWLFHSLFHGPMFPPPNPPPFISSPYGHGGGYGHFHHPYSPFGFGMRPPPPPPPPGQASPLSPPPPPTPGPGRRPGASDHDHHHGCPYIHGWWQNAQQCPYVQRQLSSSEKDDNINMINKEFKVTINVSQFAPEDLNVTVVDGHVQIIGKHEERQDNHGYITREFTRRYRLPEDVEASTVKSSLTQGGVLTVSAPRKQLETAGEVHEVPISIIEPPKIDDDKES